MSGSGILHQSVELERVNKKSATHFALCKGNRIRYLIDLNGGKRRLSGNVSAYSKKLGLLIKVLNFLPLRILEVGKFGYFVKAKLHSVIEQHRKDTGTSMWNVIVGTYDEKQKIVLQCFNETGDAIFIKIGNQSTEKEMRTEIQFLKEERRYKTFDLPILLGSDLRNQENPFSILVTKEFHGEKVAPVLNCEIIKIYQEISKEKREVNGVIYERSHGDFTPWNLRKSDRRYTLFDWEHTDFRVIGYDLMHYIMTIEIALNHRSLSEAYETGISSVKRFIPDFNAEKNIIISEYKKIIKELEY